MTIGAWELSDFVEFGRVMGRGEGERGKLLYLYRVKVSRGGSLTLTINASYTPLLVFKRRIQFLLITNWRRYGSHLWPRGGWRGGEGESGKLG